MPSHEIPFEVLALAEETTRGTAVTPPTHKLNMRGTITPFKAHYRPTDELGMLAEFSDSEKTRAWGEFEGEGRLDANNAVVVGRAVFSGAVASPATPTNGILTRLWTFPRAMTADNIKSWTSYWGDPNVSTMERMKYTLINEFSVSSGEVGGEDGATMSLAGMGQFPTSETTPAMPANAFGSLMVPGRMTLYLDDEGDAIGTTQVEGRIIAVDVTVPVGVTYKWADVGPDGTDMNFVRTGRIKQHPEMTIRLELVDNTQLAVWKAATKLKARVRYNGRLIESVTPDYYHYIEFDMIGNSDDISWGEYQESNRSIEFTIQGEYDSGLATDVIMRVQNTKATV